MAHLRATHNMNDVEVSNRPVDTNINNTNSNNMDSNSNDKHLPVQYKACSSLREQLPSSNGPNIKQELGYNINNIHNNNNNNLNNLSNGPGVKQEPSDNCAVKQEQSDNWEAKVKEEPADIDGALLQQSLSYPTEVDENGNTIYDLTNKDVYQYTDNFLVDDSAPLKRYKKLVVTT